jgi:hypothetical protein
VVVDIVFGLPPSLGKTGIEEPRELSQDRAVQVVYVLSNISISTSAGSRDLEYETAFFTVSIVVVDSGKRESKSLAESFKLYVVQKAASLILSYSWQ